ncbi:MAG: DedA family protein [Candidatus Firestonebacteria bacterium]
MIEQILRFLDGNIIRPIIDLLGYWGIVLAMTIESACIPLPSELIMPYGGILVSEGKFTLFGIALAGAFGCLIGSVITYWIGLKGGRPLLEKYGKYILITKHDMDLADRFFEKYGSWATFISRLLPVVRTFISLPAGIAKTPFLKFCIHTFTGSFIWCGVLGWVGVKFGDNRQFLKDIMHRFDLAIFLLLIAGLVWYVKRHLKHR